MNTLCPESFLLPRGRARDFGIQSLGKAPGLHLGVASPHGYGPRAASLNRELGGGRTGGKKGDAERDVQVQG